ncbi:MAG: DUF167 domain-containing protein [Halobacteriota archaeon]
MSNSMQLAGALRAVTEGVTIRVEVRPGSRYLGVTGFNPWRQTISIKLTERAEEGKANEQLVRYFALLFNKPKDDVKLISGYTSTRKVVLLCDTAVNEVESVINAVVRKEIY